MSAGYRCVNYYELCRLCTNSTGTKTDIFSEEGRKKDLIGKIAECLPVIIDEDDKLPKILCAACLTQVETIAKFRETCINAQNMLESCLNSSKLRQGGKVYIKDVTPKKTVLTSMAPALVKSSVPPLLTTTIGTTTIRQYQQPHQQQPQQQQLLVQQQQPQQQLQQQLQPQQSMTSNPVTTHNSSDFLSSIIQAVGIHNIDDSPSEPPPLQPQTHHIQHIQQQQPAPAQYTITLDGQTIKANQIHYKIEPAKTVMVQEQMQTQTYTQHTTYSNSTLSQVDEFLKLKTNPKISIKKRDPPARIATPSAKRQQQQKKMNLVIASPAKSVNPQQQQRQHQQQQTTASTTKANTTSISTISSTPNNKPITMQDIKMLSPNKCYLPIIFKDSNSDQKIMAQIDAKNFVSPTGYLQMKLQPQMTTTVGGQQIVHLTSATSNVPTSMSLGTVAQTTNTSASQPIQIQQQQRQIAQPNIISSITTTPSETKCVFTTSAGQNVTITHQPLSSITNQVQLNNQQQQHQTLPPPPLIQQPPPLCNTIDTSMGRVQLTTLQNVPTTHVSHPLPTKSGITIQRIKTEPNVKVRSTQTGNGTTSATMSVATARPRLPMKKPVVPVAMIRVPPMMGTTTTATTTSSTTATAATSEAIKTEVPTCGVCDKIFKRKEHLAQHMKLHLGLRPFKCDEANCNKSFSRKEHLMRHVVSHTGKKMFHCEYCQKLFSRKDNLNKHKRSHESKPAGTMYTVSVVKSE